MSILGECPGYTCEFANDLTHECLRGNCACMHCHVFVEDHAQREREKAEGRRKWQAGGREAYQRQRSRKEQAMQERVQKWSQQRQQQQQQQQHHLGQGFGGASGGSRVGSARGSAGAVGGGRRGQRAPGGGAAGRHVHIQPHPMPTHPMPPQPMPPHPAPTARTTIPAPQIPDGMRPLERCWSCGGKKTKKYADSLMICASTTCDSRARQTLRWICRRPACATRITTPTFECCYCARTRDATAAKDCDCHT